jgi:hypothetical protein
MAARRQIQPPLSFCIFGDLDKDSDDNANNNVDQQSHAQRMVVKPLRPIGHASGYPAGPM